MRWEDAVGREEGILTDIRTHDEGKEIARGEAKAATGRGLLGISLVVTTVTSEVGRFSHHRLRPTVQPAARQILPPLFASSPVPLPAKPGNGQRNTGKSAWFNPLGAKRIDAYIILSALVAWRNLPAASIGQSRHPSYNYWPNLDTDVPTLSSICDFTILATPASCSMKKMMYQIQERAEIMGMTPQTHITRHRHAFPPRACRSDYDTHPITF